MKQLFFILALAFSVNAYSQDDKTVTLVVSGQGKTQDEAKQSALRSAIEQAFGAFISSKSEILNDDLVKDEIVSISNGNIQKYELLTKDYIPEGYYVVTLRAVVSISKLTSFCESKGIEVSFRGDLLSANIELIEINKASELIAMKNLIKMSNDWLIKCFNYSLETSEPRNTNGRYQISLTVYTLLNSNFVGFNNYITNTLKSISLSSAEISKFDKLQIEYHKVQILNSDKSKSTVYLRNEESLNMLMELFKYPEVHLHNFIVSNNLEAIDGYKFDKVIRSDQRSAIAKHSSVQVFNKYIFFDVTIGQGFPLGAEDEYTAYAKTKHGVISTLLPIELEYNRFPLMMKGDYSVFNYDPHGRRFGKNQTLSISFFCPNDRGVVSVRQFDYSFDKEKIKSISKFEVKQYKN